MVGPPVRFNAICSLKYTKLQQIHTKIHENTNFFTTELQPAWRVGNASKTGPQLSCNSPGRDLAPENIRERILIDFGVVFG